LVDEGIEDMFLASNNLSLILETKQIEIIRRAGCPASVIDRSGNTGFKITDL
jgi:hypothetical protein